MPTSTVKVPSSSGGAFDCYLALPAASSPTPAIVLANAIVGVDEDLRGVADEFAGAGFIAAAPDLFWRTVPGPLLHEDPRTRPRGQPRLEKIKAGEADMADTLAYLRTLPQHNGRAAAMGFCYGGSSARSGSATRPAYPATAPSCSTLSANSTGFAHRSASCGATRTLPPRPRCATPIAPQRRGTRISSCTSSLASTTATCCHTAPRRLMPQRANSPWVGP
jgi:dienelactone hydrolase